MLTWMRRQSGRTWVKVMYVAIAVTFFGGFGLLSSARIQSCMGIATPEEEESDVLVKIDEKPAVTDRDFRIHYHRRLRQRQEELREKSSSDAAPAEELDEKQLRRDALKELVEEALLLLEAERLGLSVEKEELQVEIVRFYTTLTKQPTFDPGVYRQQLHARGLTEAYFEQMLKEDLLKKKIIDLLAQGVVLLPEEAEEYYAFDHEQLRLEYAVLDPAQIAAEVLPSETAVAEYYHQHKSDFFLGETRRVEFVSWSLPELMPGVTVSEEELKAYYESAKKRYQLEPEKVRALQILIKYDAEMESEEAKEKALARINEIRAEALNEGEDFSELARQYSESATKDAGGDLGWFIRQEDKVAFPEYQSMEKAIEKAAFQLSLDEVSEPILTSFGFNLIKVVDRMPAKYKSFEEVRSEVENDVRHTKALAAAVEEAKKLGAAAAQGQSWEEAARQAGKEVQRSEFFQLTDEEIFRLPDSREVIEAAFALSKGELSEPVEGMDHVFLFRVVEIKPAREGTLEEVGDRISARLKPRAEIEATVKKAQEFLARLQAGEMDFARLSEEPGVSLHTLDPTQRYLISLPDLGYSDTLAAELAVMTEDTPWPREPVVLNGKVVLLHLLGLEPADLSSFDKDKSFYERLFLMRKQKEAVEEWLKRETDSRVEYTARGRGILEEE